MALPAFPCARVRYAGLRESIGALIEATAYNISALDFLSLVAGSARLVEAGSFPSERCRYL
jgi:hypothetical protein